MGGEHALIGGQLVVSSSVHVIQLPLIELHRWCPHPDAPKYWFAPLRIQVHKAYQFRKVWIPRGVMHLGKYPSGDAVMNLYTEVGRLQQLV